MIAYIINVAESIENPEPFTHKVTISFGEAAE